MENVNFIKISTKHEDCRITFFVEKNVIFYTSNYHLKFTPIQCPFDESWFEIIKRTHWESIYKKITDFDWRKGGRDAECYIKCCEQFVKELKQYVNEKK